MTKDITPFIKKATEDIRMTDAERQYLWSQIEEYKAMKPLAHSGRARLAASSLPLAALLMRPLALALVLVVVFTGSISYAAEDSLPGSPLYAIKTRVNEPVRVALASGAEARADVQIELAERRIAEAAALAAEGRLDADTQEKLAVAFEAHAQSAAAVVEEVETSDSSAAAEISSRFETRLAAHESVLARVEDDNRRDSRLSRSIRDVGLAVASIRTRAEQKVAVSAQSDLAMDIAPMALSVATESMVQRSASVETVTESSVQEDAGKDNAAAKRMRDSAERNLKSTQKSVKNSKSLNAETRVETEAELKRADELLKEGRDHLKNGVPALAFHAFQQSLIISEKLAVMVKSAPSLEKARARGALAKRPQETRSAKQDDRGSSENARSLSLPLPAALSTTGASGASATASSALEIGATSVPPSVLPPSTQIFIPDADVLQGVIHGASTSKEEDDTDEDDDRRNGGKGHGSSTNIDINLPL